MQHEFMPKGDRAVRADVFGEGDRVKGGLSWEMELLRPLVGLYFAQI